MVFILSIIEQSIGVAVSVLRVGGRRIGGLKLQILKRTKKVENWV